MKNIFVVNPFAGKTNALASIESMLAQKQDFEYEIYVTKERGDATAFVKKKCEESDEDIRFFSCGGDGTLNEVASGCVGHSNAILAIYPSGSGNDYVKYYGGKEQFLDIDNLLEGRETKIDIIQVGDRYAVNACHFGLDSAVAKTMNAVRHKKIIGGKNAYNTGVLKALFTAMKTKCKVIGDGEPLNDDKILLCTVANGKYVGGSYKSSPRSRNDDGLMEVCCIKPVSIFKFLNLIKVYKEGTHLENEKLKKYLVYRRCKSVEIIGGQKNFAISLDGEIVEGDRFEVNVLEKELRFIIPKGCEEI
ncbi:MAG: diacylglycerol kinase family lipid kinase [Clostridiales bacterium]|nr:diacylglycerol kinase family lipid kinase [Clostridiales bacterium]